MATQKQRTGIVHKNETGTSRAICGAKRAGFLSSTSKYVTCGNCLELMNSAKKAKKGFAARAESWSGNPPGKNFDKAIAEAKRRGKAAGQASPGRDSYLSGEWAGESENELIGDILEPFLDDEADEWKAETIRDEYENAAQDASAMSERKVLKLSGRKRIIPLREKDRENPPKMTRQDFQLVADVIRDLDLSDTEDKRHVAYRFAAALRQTNPNFAEQRFLVACGAPDFGARKNPRGRVKTTSGVMLGGKQVISNEVKEIRYRHAKGGKRLYKHTFGAHVSLFGMPDGTLMLRKERGNRALWENRTVGDKE